MRLRVFRRTPTQPVRDAAEPLDLTAPASTHPGGAEAVRVAALEILDRAALVGCRMLIGDDRLSKQAAEMRALVNEARDVLLPDSAS